MAELQPPTTSKQLLSVAQCLTLEGDAKGALRKVDFLIRQSVILVKSGLTPDERAEVESALTAVLMTVAADMAFLACGEGENGLRERAHVLLDESLDWSDKKGSTNCKREDFEYSQKHKNDNDA